MKSPLKTTTAIALALMPAAAIGQTFNLYGNTGLIDMPSAESQADGQLGFTFSNFDDTQRTAFHFQAMPWLSGTVRFSESRDVPGGPDRSDRTLDLKFRLLEENGWRPSVALGFRDILGEGNYGAEYLVATKSVTDTLKVTGGIGWGRLGSYEGFSNPFGSDTRPGLETPNGQLQDSTFFKGDAAFFGGVEWQTPLKGITVKAEYSSDAYDPEVGGGFERDSPFNFGLTYSPNENVQLSTQYLYGSTIGFQVTLTGNPNRPLTPQDLGTGPVPVRARPADAPRNPNWARSPKVRTAVIDALGEALAPEGIILHEARISGEVVELYINNTRIQREPKAIGRVARILALSMPPSVEVFRITPVSNGLPTTTVEFRRSDIEAQVDRPNAGAASWATTELTDAAPHIQGDDAWIRPVSPRLSWAINPRIPVNILDADEGIRPDALIAASATYRLTHNLSVSGQISRFIVGEDQETVDTSTSTLPHVRSDSDLYFSGRDIELDRLTADYVFKAAPAVYGRVSAGYFERMFAGVSGEVLWAPTASRIALGAEVNYARKRDFDDAIGLADYDIVTGHASVYWDTGFHGLEAQLDVGRYLAGDWGATLGVSRRFANGWDVSAYITRTDVSFDEYGEGSFAKGISITVPLRWSLPFENKSRATLELVADTRDGGARLQVPDRLYPKVRDYDTLSLNENWGSVWQ